MLIIYKVPNPIFSLNEALFVQYPMCAVDCILISIVIEHLMMPKDTVAHTLHSVCIGQIIVNIFIGNTSIKYPYSTVVAINQYKYYYNRQAKSTEIIIVYSLIVFLLLII